MKTVFRILAFTLVLVMLAGCAVQVTPDTTATTAATTAGTTAATTAGTTAGTTESSETTAATETIAPTEVPISDFRFSSDAGSPNSREELVKLYPDFAKDHEAKVVCFEMGWTGPVAEKDFVTPEIAKRTGFKMIYESMTVNSDEELVTKLNLMVSSGEVPDIFFGSSSSYSLDVYEKLGQAGFIYDMAPVLAKYENINNLLMPELIKYRKTDDAGSHNWFIPTQTGRGNDLLHSCPSGLYLRKDLLQKLDMEYPTTTAELKTYLERCLTEVKEVDGKPLLPMTFEEDMGGLWNIVSIFMPMEHAGIGFDWENNFKAFNYQYTNSPELIKAMQYLNELYRAGLIDKEVVSMKREQISQKVSSGQVVAINCPWWDMNTFSDNAKTEVPDLMYVATKPLIDEEIGVKHREWTNWVGMYSTLTFSKKLDEETVNHFVAMMDYFVNMDGQVLVQAGLPGVSFELNADGKYKFTDAFKKDTADLDWNKVAATGVYYWQQLVFNLPAFDALRAEYPELVRQDNYEGWLNKELSRNLYNATMLPPKDYYFDAGPIERDKMTALNDAFKKLLADCILAKDAAEVEQLVNDYGAQCKVLGIDEVMAERQTIIDSINADAN